MSDSAPAGRDLRVCLAAERDLAAWLALAAEVEPLFGPMVGDPAFHHALRRNIARGTAFCVRQRDGAPGAPLVGGLLFSPHPPHYRIGWLAVARAARRQGVGRLLVAHALSTVRPPAEVSVVTFGQGVPGGTAARAFYARLGFVPGEPAAAGPEGGPRQVWRLQVPRSLLVLIRHSLPAIDLTQPAARWTLSVEGRLRCEALAERLAPLGLQAVVSSAYPKAVETAEIVGRLLSLPVSTALGLQEQDRSQRIEGGEAAFRAALARMFACPEQRVMGSESAVESLERFRAALQAVLDRHPRQRVAAVTHGTVLSLYLAEREGMDAHWVWQRLGMPCFAVLSRPELRLVALVGRI